MKEVILCKYGELILKGANRGTFEAVLQKELRRRARHAGEFRITTRQSTVMIEPLSDDPLVSDVDEMYRKLYDSCIMLVEVGVLTWNDCRSYVTGVLVQENAPHRFSAYDLPGTTRPATAPLYEYALPSDLALMKPDTDYRLLAGYLMKKVYVLTPNDFDVFGQQRGWQ